MRYYDKEAYKYPTGKNCNFVHYFIHSINAQIMDHKKLIDLFLLFSVAASFRLL
jgi:hypothetical protein